MGDVLKLSKTKGFTVLEFARAQDKDLDNIIELWRYDSRKSDKGQSSWLTEKDFQDHLKSYLDSFPVVNLETKSKKIVKNKTLGNTFQFSWLKWPFKKNKKMKITEQSILDARIYYSAFDFQWIKGDDTSMIEKFRDITVNGELTFIEFQSGKRVNQDLLNEYMITFPCAPPAQTANPVSPARQINTQKPSDFSVTSIDYPDAKNPANDSPIYKLLKKQKKNIVEVSIKLKLNLPPKDLYSVLSGSFEDVEKEIIDFVLDGVDIDSIKASLAESIRKNYYSDGVKSPEPVKKGNKKDTNE